MKVVDEEQSIRAIEEKLNFGIIEKLIEQSHRELKFLKQMKCKLKHIYYYFMSLVQKPWETIFTDEYIEENKLLMKVHRVFNIYINNIYMYDIVYCWFPT